MCYSHLKSLWEFLKDSTILNKTEFKIKISELKYIVIYLNSDMNEIDEILMNEIAKNN